MSDIGSPNSVRPWRSTNVSAWRPAAGFLKMGAAGTLSVPERATMKLLVPVDGSEAALHAVHHALKLVKGQPDAVVILLNVQNHQTLGLSDISDEPLDEHELATRRSVRELRSACRACRDAGVRFVSRAAFGPICETIDRIAQESHVDQIVMGTRGLSRLAGMVLGSVGTEVVHRARVPVTLVKSCS